MSPLRLFRLPLSLALALAACACGGSDDAATSGGGGAAGSGGAPGDTLDAWGLFADAPKQLPAADVVPYDTIVTLYADEATKHRFVRIPAGQQATYADDTQWTWPDGTILVKTFSFLNDMRDPSLGERLIETRLLVKEAGAWTGRVYLWDDAQKVATRMQVGKLVSVSYIDENGQTRSHGYRVPNENQCTICHSMNHVIEPLGPRTRQLARTVDYGDGKGPVDQIDHWASLGILGGAIQSASARFALSDPYGSDPLDRRARSYLEANCSHCHRPGGAASATNLDLRIDDTKPLDYGVCRTPTAAGPGSGDLLYDVVPGQPDQSIMIFRMSSIAPEVKMPQIPTQTSDAKGVALIREWIASMTDPPCQ